MSTTYEIFCSRKADGCVALGPPAPAPQSLTFKDGDAPPWIAAGLSDTQSVRDQSCAFLCENCAPVVAEEERAALRAEIEAAIG